MQEFGLPGCIMGALEASGFTNILLRAAYNKDIKNEVRTGKSQLTNKRPYTLLHTSST